MKELNLIISEEKINKEFDKIKLGVDNGYKTKYSWNEIVLYFQWKEFYKKEINLWQQNSLYKGLPLRSYIYANRLKYIKKGFNHLSDREILRAFKIAGIHIGNSFHSPFYIRQFIKDYNINSIYDPCGGWGHRLLGSYDIRYIYNDINRTTYLNCIKMCDYFKLNNKYFHCSDSAELTPKENYEAVFTCPPYFNTEIYSSKGAENYNHKQFMKWWKQTVIASTNKDSCKYFCFIMNAKYLQEMQTICLDLGLRLENQISLGSTNQISHFNKKRNNIKSEILSIFTLNF